MLTDILLTVVIILVAVLAIIIWRGMDNIYSYLDTIYYSQLGNVSFPIPEGSIMDTPQIDGDTRADDISNARGDKTPLGTFYITDDGRGVEFALVNPTMYDLDTFAACMVQLIAHFMNVNPDVSEMKMMGALRSAMMRAMTEAQE